MSLGSVWLQFQQKYQHGLHTAYYRDQVRPRILRTQPVVDTTDCSCEVHVLTSSSDWMNLVWTLKSFYRYAQRQYALCIHDDGSLTPEIQSVLKYHFPNARLIDRPSADARIFAKLEAYPRCLDLRKSNHLAPKVFDFASYLESDRMLLLDSDILFYRSPIELLQRIEDPNYLLNTVNGDIANAYTVDPKMVQEKCGVEVIHRFNSGLGLIHRASLNLDWIEEFLSLPGIVGHFWQIEQTLYALCSSRFGGELLPDVYTVRLDQGIRNSPSRHYVGAIRHLMYREGIRQLVRQGFLKERSR